jgi:hypothetical protein
VTFAVTALVGLLAMNAAFGAWQAGNCPGPRYLCAAFPCIALAIALYYDRFSSGIKAALWATTVPALLLYLVVISTVLDADAELPLWRFYADWLQFRGATTLAWLGPMLIAGWLIILRLHPPRQRPATTTS